MKLIHIGGRQGRALCGIRMPFQIPINAPRMCLRCLNAVGELRLKNGSRIAVGGEAYKAGPKWLMIDPFTPNERWVLEDSEEGKAWLAAHPPSGKPLRITKIDRKRRTITLE